MKIDSNVLYYSNKLDEKGEDLWFGGKDLYLGLKWLEDDDFEKFFMDDAHDD